MKQNDCPFGGNMTCLKPVVVLKRLWEILTKSLPAPSVRFPERPSRWQRPLRRR